MLLGLSGKAGVGKDAVADYLVSQHGFKRYAFADAVREVALAINPILMTNWVVSIDKKLPTLKEFRLADAVDVHGWDKAKREMPEVRRLLQVIGTETGRMIMGENVWIDIVAKQWEHDGFPNAVITDMRFLNEVSWVSNVGGTTVQIERPNNPNAISSTHVSEQVVFYCDYILKNSGTLKDLDNQVAQLLKEISS